MPICCAGSDCRSPSDPGLVRRYTGLTITEASFSGIRFTHLTLPRKTPFLTSPLEAHLGLSKVYLLVRLFLLSRGGFVQVDQNRRRLLRDSLVLGVALGAASIPLIGEPFQKSSNARERERKEPEVTANVRFSRNLVA